MDKYFLEILPIAQGQTITGSRAYPFACIERDPAILPGYVHDTATAEGVG